MLVTVAVPSVVGPLTVCLLKPVTVSEPPLPRPAFAVQVYCFTAPIPQASGRVCCLQGVGVFAAARRLLSLGPDRALWAGMKFAGVGPRPTGGWAFEVRAFFPGNGGIAEDPVTGSLNAAMAQWLIGAGLAPPRYVASQGTALGRVGRVHVEQDAQSPETIWIGGACVTCIEGQVTL